MPREKVMSGNSVFSSEELATLTQTVAKHCAMRGIVDALDKEAVARAVLALYESGMTSVAEMLGALDRKMAA